MCDTRQISLMAGIGSVEDVATELLNLPNNETEIIGAIKDAKRAMYELNSIDTGRPALLSLLAAYANQDFRKSGKLYFVGGNSHLDWHYYIDEGQRRLIADLAGIK